MDIKPVRFLGDRLRLLDQTRLPLEEVYLEVREAREVAAALREMRVRGAPAIGVVAAYGLALAAQGIESQDRTAFLAALEEAGRIIGQARPTAVNLRWAVERLLGQALAHSTVAEMKAALLAEAEGVDRENRRANETLSRHGAKLLRQGQRVLTNCNTGALATAAEYGTALGVIRAAWEEGKRLHVLVDETRPLLQGARLTAWELRQLGIPCTLITDSAAGFSMKQGAVHCVLVGADRIAANGDTANKIGTYTLAVLAREHGIPFYVAAPVSSIDPLIPSGDEIPIEERDPEEVRSLLGAPIAPPGVEVYNPAFDVTPHHLITAIITEGGIIQGPDFQGGIQQILQEGVQQPLAALQDRR